MLYEDLRMREKAYSGGQNQAELEVHQEDDALSKLNLGQWINQRKKSDPLKLSPL